MSSEFVATIYGLSSAVSWGVGDFSGGLATKQKNVYSVVFISQIFGLLALLALALISAEQLPSLDDIFWGVLAGTCGVLGILALYSGLATNMGIVSPVSSVTTVVIPLLVGLFLETFPTPLQISGFLLAFVAIWLVSFSDYTYHLQSLKLAVLAGTGFGFFLVFIDRVTTGALFFPLVAARLASLGVLTIILLTKRQIDVPKDLKMFIVIVLAGIFDIGGNTFFALAAQTGRLDIAAVLTSFFPVVTVFLAWLILKEKITRLQIIGMVLAVLCIILITI
ncbi:MAG: DMT family transporter [Candidatus Heimdallarchaeota archaeon]